MAWKSNLLMVSCVNQNGVIPHESSTNNMEVSVQDLGGTPNHPSFG